MKPASLPVSNGRMDSIARGKAWQGSDRAWQETLRNPRIPESGGTGGGDGQPGRDNRGVSAAGPIPARHFQAARHPSMRAPIRESD
jgi:hypothetical protein